MSSGCHNKIVESLIYPMIGSCPNIEFAIVKLVQQIANLSNEHYQARLHLNKYLLNTYKYWIVYNGLNNESVITHSNSN